MTPNELDPNNLEPRLSDPVPRGDEQSSPAKMAVFAIIAVALIGGLIFFSQGNNNTTASNTAPGVTTGSAPASR
jgi:hypothetical protein